MINLIYLYFLHTNKIYSLTYANKMDTNINLY